MTKKMLAALAGAILTVQAGLALAAEPIAATVYKSETCGCCDGYVEHLRENGFTVDARNIEDMDRVKRMLGVPPALASCHTMVVGGYVVEGHVPLESVHKLLNEKPRIRGISLPGMPTGVPGMPGPKPPRLPVYTIADRPEVFDVR